MKREDGRRIRRGSHGSLLVYLFFLITGLGGGLMLQPSPVQATTVFIRTGSAQGLGVEFDVEVVVDSVTNLYGLAVDLTYDPEYIEVVDRDGTGGNGIQPKVTEGMFLNNNGSDETLIEAALENQTPGVLVLGITRSGSVGGVNASTERTILSARFKTRKEGTTSVSFRNPGLKDPGDGDISVSAWTGVTFTISESYPVISVSCTKTDFGLVNVGGESSATCTVSNIGTADLLIDSISLSNTTDFSQSNNCSAPVVSGGSCSILLTFAPKAEGLKTTTLSIVSNDSGSPYQAEFRGVGVSPPNLLMSYSILSEDFSGGMPVRWVAGGERDIWSAGDPCSHGTLVSPFASPWAIVDPLCAGGSAPNEELFSSVFDGTSCTNATLFFTNQYSHGMDGSAGVGVSSDEGVTWTGLMRMEVNDGFPVPNTKAVDLGAGTLSESMMVKFTYSGSDGFWAIDNVLVLCNDPAALPFSSLVGGSASQIVILSNTGMGDLHVESVTRTGEDATEFSIPSSEDECTGSTVGPSGYCTFQVVFSPTSRGIKTAALSIVSDDPKSPLNVLLNGIGHRFTVNPGEGTLGTVMEVGGSGFGATKGKVLIGDASVSIVAKVLAWGDESIRCSLSKTLVPGTYRVTVSPKVPKGTPPIVEEDAYSFKAPQILWMSRYKGSVNDTVTIRGRYFGTKKGKVYIGTKSCKVVSWVMDPETNYGEIVFTVPKGLALGPYDLKVVNKVGTGIAEFTIE